MSSYLGKLKSKHHRHKPKNHQKKRDSKEVEIRMWDNDFKSFILYSNNLWKQKYPGFRSNYQGDKIIGYKLVDGITKIPKQYYLLKNIHRLNHKLISNIPDNSFVIKAALGHQGNKVLCFEKVVDPDTNKYYYREQMRSKAQRLDEKGVVSYAIDKIGKREGENMSRIIIEEFVGDPKKGIPIDYKVYTVLGKAQLINLYIRTPEAKYMLCFDRNWNRIPLDRFYVHPKKLGYVDKPKSFPIMLPPKETRRQLINMAEKLAQTHEAKFCRYDFYCEGDKKDKIYFGEITPVCGGLKKHKLTGHVLKILFPHHLRKEYWKH